MAPREILLSEISDGVYTGRELTKSQQNVRDAEVVALLTVYTQYVEIKEAEE